MRTNVGEFLISEGLQIPTRMTNLTNHQRNKMILLVVYEAVEAEKKSRTKKITLEPTSGSHHPRTFIGILGGSPSIKMAGLGSNFPYEENKSMAVETLE